MCDECMRMYVRPRTDEDADPLDLKAPAAADQAPKLQKKLRPDPYWREPGFDYHANIVRLATDLAGRRMYSVEYARSGRIVGYERDELILERDGRDLIKNHSKITLLVPDARHGHFIRKPELLYYDDEERS